MQLPLVSGYHVNREAQLQSSHAITIQKLSQEVMKNVIPWSRMRTGSTTLWGLQKGAQFCVGAHHSGWWFYWGGNSAQGSKFRCKSPPQEPVPKESWESTPTTPRVRWTAPWSSWSAQTLPALITALTVLLISAGSWDTYHMYETLYRQYHNLGDWSCIHSCGGL